MRVNVTFRHTEPTKALKEYVEEKISKVTRFLDRPQEANVILSVEKIRHIADVIITADGLTITGKESTQDLYSAIDKVMDKIERQVKKGKSRRKKRKSSKSIRTTHIAPSVETELETMQPVAEDDEQVPSVIQSDLFLPKPMTVEDATVELISRKWQLVVFRNAATMEICVLHKNPDGTLGLVAPAGK